MKEKNLLNKLTNIVDGHRSRENRWPTLRELRMEFFPTTWNVMEWNNVPGNESSLTNGPFQDTKLAKGLFGKFLYNLGYSWELSSVKGERLASEGVYTSRFPYCVKNKAIVLHIDKKTLENLYKNNINKFKCTYRYYSGI